MCKTQAGPGKPGPKILVPFTLFHKLKLFKIGNNGMDGIPDISKQFIFRYKKAKIKKDA